MITRATYEPARKPTFRVAPWYSVLTAPLRFVASPAWAWVYRRRLGVRRLKDLPVESWKRGDTAFILGSGPSISDLTEGQWAEIRQGTSIGFNWWLHHPHVPDLYVFENVSESHRRLLQLRAADYAATPLILKQFLSNFSPRKHGQRLRLLRILSEDIRRNVHMSSDFLLPGRTVEELRHWYRRIERLGLLRSSQRFQWVPKRTSSLTFLVALCVRAGFRRIVLCGVDLNRPGYFFEAGEKEGAVEMAATAQVSSPTLHETEDARAKVLPISLVLGVFSDEILTPRGIQIHVGHSESALAPKMAVYAWTQESH